jgi:hypothetical protein
MSEHRTLNTFCPTCGYRANAATNINDKQTNPPSCGDISVCLKCGEILQFDAQLKLQPASLTNLLQISKEDGIRVARAQRIIRAQRPLGI